MKKLNTITIYRKVSTQLKFDLSNFIYPVGSKLVWTVKENENGEELMSREFTESRLYSEVITPEEGNRLTKTNYFYDIVLVLADGTKLLQCYISDIVTKGVIYGTTDNNTE